MDRFESVIDLLMPYSPLIMLVGLAGMYFSFRRLQGMESANWIVKNQCEKASPETFNDLLDYAEAQGKKDRVLAILVKARQELGHENMKVGHVAWLTFIMDDDTPIEKIEIPSFEKK